MAFLSKGGDADTFQGPCLWGCFGSKWVKIPSTGPVSFGTVQRGVPGDLRCGNASYRSLDRLRRPWKHGGKELNQEMQATACT